MPVVTLYFDRISKILGKKIPKTKIVDTLPFIGLDVEEETSNHINVEYSPNRPDYSTDYGIITGLQGLLEIKLGMPRLKIKSGKNAIKADASVSKVRPYVTAIEARNGVLNDETIRQIITMQEDLHNGLGRRRKKTSIGIHDLDKIKFPLYYKTVAKNHNFISLESDVSMTIKEMLEKTDAGKKYEHILEGKDKVPMLIDSVGNTVSFPPIINSRLTEINNKTRNLLVEVTATDKNAAEGVLAVLANALQVAGFQLFSVRITGANNFTPSLKPRDLILEPELVNKTLGIDISSSLMIKSLKKSRLDARMKGKKIICTIPRYRTDIFGVMDLVEEVALGYGIQNLVPTMPESVSAGERNDITKSLEIIRSLMVGLGYTEVMNFELTGKEILYEKTNRDSSKKISVADSKSQEHMILRDVLLPGMMEVLSRNIHESYPQKIFEIGTVFEKGSSIREVVHLACLDAHKDANFTEIKSVLQSLLKIGFNLTCETIAQKEHMFVDGRTGNIVISGKKLGTIGEVDPKIADNFKLRTSISGFEMKLTGLIFD
ncbi:phenylalanine--tRNA ligase subunit beta [Candidatus Nitrosotalea okcheonensis]|uniref:phenylalanine--tRNA ligase n=1 Tax=Candidatus Nitrosotalea okcheonensis TaxID=1903276 RepID=A0A2H1FG12_9ARCH|nr:phenylalanine--tRNA ligase subunit beta [Candidatus Nitrosotalea okcheonensis]SMH71711.1 Phenylalanyl-tRNA synthetase, beta subunit [Candidatus Nitrosotalea okcheonensis]